MNWNSIKIETQFPCTCSFEGLPIPSSFEVEIVSGTSTDSCVFADVDELTRELLTREMLTVLAKENDGSNS